MWCGLLCVMTMFFTKFFLFNNVGIYYTLEINCYTAWNDKYFLEKLSNIVFITFSYLEFWIYFYVWNILTTGMNRCNIDFFHLHNLPSMLNGTSSCKFYMWVLGVGNLCREWQKNISYNPLLPQIFCLYFSSISSVHQ